MAHESHESPLDIETGTYLDDSLDGVTWNGKDVSSRKFQQQFTESLRTCRLTGRQKLLIEQRYLTLYEKYNNNYKLTKVCYNISRVLVTVGSILTSAVVALDEEISDRSTFSQTIYYISFGISLCVTISNGLSELFSLTDRYNAYLSAKESLKTEGWIWLIQTGRYKKYNDHTETWRKFLRNCERINLDTINTKLSWANHKDEGQGGGEQNQIIEMVDDNSSDSIIVTNH